MNNTNISKHMSCRATLKFNFVRVIQCQLLMATQTNVQEECLTYRISITWSSVSSVKRSVELTRNTLKVGLSPSKINFFYLLQ